MKPSVGRIVHFVSGNHLHPNQAAIVSRVHSDECVDLHVMSPDPQIPVKLETSVTQDPHASAVHSWHWPERE